MDNGGGERKKENIFLQSYIKMLLFFCHIHIIQNPKNKFSYPDKAVSKLSSFKKSYIIYENIQKEKNDILQK